MDSSVSSFESFVQDKVSELLNILLITTIKFLLPFWDGMCKHSLLSCRLIVVEEETYVNFNSKFTGFRQFSYKFLWEDCNVQVQLLN